MTELQHVYEVRPRKDKRGVDLISDALPLGRPWYGEPNAVSNTIDYAKFRSRSHDAVIRVCDEAGNVIETHEHAANFENWQRLTSSMSEPRLRAESPGTPDHHSLAECQSLKQK
jgi:hypothetical protein